MASGTTPFAGESAIELLLQRIRTVPKDLRLAKTDIPKYFGRIVMRCLERDPANRYQRAHDIVADLDAGRAPSKSRSQPAVSINLPLPTPRGWLFAGIAAAAIVGLLAVPPVRHFVFRSGTTTAGIPSAAEKKLIASCAIYLMTGRYALAAARSSARQSWYPRRKPLQISGSRTPGKAGFRRRYRPTQKAVETSPNVDGWLSNLGDGYRWVGQSQKVTEAYDRAIALAYDALQVNSSDARTRSYLGTYYAKKGDTAQGIKLVREAATADPNEVSILYNVAVVHALAGQPGPALDALAKALKAGILLGSLRTILT